MEPLLELCWEREVVTVDVWDGKVIVPGYDQKVMAEVQHRVRWRERIQDTELRRWEDHLHL